MCVGLTIEHWWCAIATMPAGPGYVVITDVAWWVSWLPFVVVPGVVLMWLVEQQK